MTEELFSGGRGWNNTGVVPYKGSVSGERGWNNTGVVPYKGLVYDGRGRLLFEGPLLKISQGAKKPAKRKDPN